MLAFGREFSNTFISIRLLTVPAATSHVADLSHVVLCVSVFSVEMVKSEPEVLANKGEKCYHCRLRHHDHGHRQHQCGLFTPAENTMRAVLISLW